jgi:heat shock protein HslJ
MTDGASNTKGRSIEGPLWRVRAVIAEDDSLGAVPDEVEATARFESGRISGSGGCNRYAADCVVDGPRLRIGPIAGTLMACPDPAAATEALVLAALDAAAAWAIEDGTLCLRDATGRDLLVLEPVAEPALVGTAWGATGVNNGRGGVASLVAGTAIDAVFGEDGRLAGRAGCNRYVGPFLADGPTLSIGPLATTRMACPPPVMEQEAAYLAALARTTTARIDGDRLELRDDAGALQVAFRAER